MSAEETCEESPNEPGDDLGETTGSTKEIDSLEPVAWISDGGAILDVRRSGYDHPLVRLSEMERLWEDAIEHLQAMKCGEDGCENCTGIDMALSGVRARREKLREITQNTED